MDFKNSCRLTVVRDFAIIKGFSKVPTSSEKINQQLNQFYELGNIDSESYNQNLENLKFKAKKYSKMCLNDYKKMTLK